MSSRALRCPDTRERCHAFKIEKRRRAIRAGDGTRRAGRDVYADSADVAPLSVTGNRIFAGGKPASLAGNSLFWSNTGWGGEQFYNGGVVRWLKTDWKANVVRAAMGVEAPGGYLQDRNANLGASRPWWMPHRQRSVRDHRLAFAPCGKPSQRSHRVLRADGARVWLAKPCDLRDLQRASADLLEPRSSHTQRR